jgi:diguanylate cyclase (GGDEF)-like protein
MNTISPSSLYKPYLISEDLIQNKERLEETLAKFIIFNEAIIFFPQHIPDEMISKDNEFKSVYRQDENTLLLPLVNAKKILGVMLFKGVFLKDPCLSCSYLDHYITVCLEKIALEKVNQYDQLTGLVNKDCFMNQLTQYLENISKRLDSHITSILDHQLKGYTGQLGLIAININRFKKINNNYGYTFGDRILKELAEHLRSCSSETTIISRLHNDLFVILIANGNAKKCRYVAERLKFKIQEAPIEDPITQIKISISLRIGYAVYPNDFSGMFTSTLASERAHRLIENALTAMKRSHNKTETSILGFSDILNHTGIILEKTTPETVLTNLGSNVQAQEGAFFCVYSQDISDQQMRTTDSTKDHLLKGEIILTKVNETNSLAEILYLQDPKQDITSGDRLVWHEVQQSKGRCIDCTEYHPKTECSSFGILSLRDFFIHWNTELATTDTFCLSLCNRSVHAKSPKAEALFTDPVQLDQYLLSMMMPSDVAVGRYGYNSLILYFPNKEQEEVVSILETFNQRAAADHDLIFHIGLATYPLLQHTKHDTLLNCRKALEHAKLLEAPTLVCYNTVSQTIYADRIFNQGNIAHALSEYQVALLHDSNNTLARNSLGICHASLGQKDRAYKEFEKVINQEPENTMGLFNLGYLAMKIGEYSKAQSLFEKCLHLSKGKSFCLLRLGQIAEFLKRYEDAKKYYLQACEYDEGKKFGYRFMAQLEILRDNTEQARTLLHKSITHNPFDAEAIYLLAQLYYQQKEDMDLIESLVKKCLSLRPNIMKYMSFLEEILVQQGKENDVQALQARKLNGFHPYAQPWIHQEKQ